MSRKLKFIVKCDNCDSKVEVSVTSSHEELTYHGFRSNGEDDLCGGCYKEFSEQEV